MTIVDHVEEYLGEISEGWKDDGTDESLQIVSFKDCPEQSVTTFLSLGLSGHVLDITETKSVRQELVCSMNSMDIPALVVSFLLSMCEAVLSRGRALLRGEVVPLSSDLARRMGFDAAYCAIPVLFDSDFATYRESSPPTVMVWMLPIYQSEVDYVTTKGWESFEDLLEQKNPDLCTLNRLPIA